jgi:hypothetical protein
LSQRVSPEFQALDDCSTEISAAVLIPMRTFTQNGTLTDAELDRLSDYLKSCKGGRAMNIEQLDGFFAALIAGPETVMPSECYPEVFGGRMSDTSEFGSLDEANEILGLMIRHWNTIARTLNKGEVYGPPSSAPAPAPRMVCSTLFLPRPLDSMAPSTSTFSPDGP